MTGDEKRLMQWRVQRVQAAIEAIPRGTLIGPIGARDRAWLGLRVQEAFKELSNLVLAIARIADEGDARDLPLFSGAPVEKNLYTLRATNGPRSYATPAPGTVPLQRDERVNSGHPALQVVQDTQETRRGAW